MTLVSTEQGVVRPVKVKHRLSTPVAYGLSLIIGIGGAGLVADRLLNNRPAAVASADRGSDNGGNLSPGETGGSEKPIALSTPASTPTVRAPVKEKPTLTWTPAAQKPTGDNGVDKTPTVGPPEGFVELSDNLLVRLGPGFEGVDLGSGEELMNGDTGAFVRSALNFLEGHDEVSTYNATAEGGVRHGGRIVTGIEAVDISQGVVWVPKLGTASDVTKEATNNGGFGMTAGVDTTGRLIVETVTNSKFLDKYSAKELLEMTLFWAGVRIAISPELGSGGVPELGYKNFDGRNSAHTKIMKDLEPYWPVN